MIKIGLIIQDLAGDYSNKIVSGTKKYCLEHNIQLFIFTVRAKNWKSSGTYDYQHFAAKSLATKENLDGILLIANTYCQHTPKAEHHDIIHQLATVPLVSFGEEVDGLCSVIGNAEKAFTGLLQHLEEDHGCKNIYLMGPHNTTSKDILLRFSVFEKFQKARNRNYEGMLLFADYAYERAQETLTEHGITKDNLPFDAIVCCNDTLAVGCIDYLASRGIRVPEDVKVTGFDNQVRCDFTSPTLTSIDQCIEDQCCTAAKLLHQQITSGNAQKQNYYIDAKAIFRDSCGCSYQRKNLGVYERKYELLKPQIKQYQYFLQDLQAQLEAEKIISYYKTFGIQSCVCCFYNRPKKMLNTEDFILPDSAYIYFAYNGEKTFAFDDNFCFNPKETLYPENFSFAPNKEVIVNALFNKEYQYGYILYTPGELDYNIYDLLITTTGISLATLMVISEQNEEQQKLNYDKQTLETETYFDELTGVLNRRGFFKYAVPALNDAVERNLSGGIIFGDMDGLKYINDTFGHDAGDRAIKGTAEILKAVFRAEDLIARFGGDEFVIYSCGLTEEGFNRLKARLKEKAGEYNKAQNEPFNIAISLGYTEFNQNHGNLDALITDADKKQYAEKLLRRKHSAE